jgi:D-serine deaminase-like pyridoxal phosphate-dependent protein
MNIGDNLFDLDTPALWVDLDLMEANIQLMANTMRAAGVNWRPHTKGIKVPAIAQRLLAAGATGVTCAKVSEAEFMSAAGIRDILIGNQVVGRGKIARLIALQKRSDVMVAVDDLDNAAEISAMAVEAGVRVRVLVELNIGMERGGIAPFEHAVSFARRLLDLPGIVFKGFMGWEGHIVGITDPLEKDREGRDAMRKLIGTAEMTRQAGIPVEIVSCGGTGSYKISAYTLGVTEIQAGGACFGDRTYKAWGADTTPSLFVLTSVTSSNTPGRAVVDGGRKTFDARINPVPVGLEGVEYDHASSEHGVLKISNPDVRLKVGDKINFLVGYGDWTVYLHERLYGIRKGVVEEIWEIPHRLA